MLHGVLHMQLLLSTADSLAARKHGDEEVRIVKKEHGWVEGDKQRREDTKSDIPDCLTN